jgi:hypothetical protein
MPAMKSALRLSNKRLSNDKTNKYKSKFRLKDFF